MIVSDVFKRLSLGHLSNLAMANDGDGTIKVNAQSKIITYMNDALLKLYSRFCLREKDVIILQRPDITNYHLDKRFAKFNPDRPEGKPVYIIDLPEEPFSNDAINILSVRDLHRPRSLNNGSDRLSLYTPSPTQLQVPNPQEDQPLFVIYQAAHIKLEYGVTNTEIFLPLVLEEAFMSHIAFNVFNDIGTAENLSRAQTHIAMYENACAVVEQQGLASITSESFYHKFHERGFI